VRTPSFHVVALHGFLGSPDDWRPIQSRMSGVSWSPLDLWRIIERHEVRDWKTLGASLEREIGEAVVASAGLPAIGLAYSFGARLMLAAPGAVSRLAGTCLVSCNPGLRADDHEARDARRRSDDAWADRLIDLPPSAFFEGWNRQAVLASSSPMEGRTGFPAERSTLAKALRSFSLSGQPDWAERLDDWPGPLLLLAGERDEKFAAIARQFDVPRQGRAVRVVAGAGHRVPWDEPDVFVEVFAAWANDLIRRSEA
jgi:2-succinyl-6-hydroxy-2,4-cyclohexadiene-1-carboxylate synthase